MLDEVARSRTTIVVTKHGKPVAKLVPINDEPSPTRGSVTLLADDDEAYFSTGETYATARALNVPLLSKDRLLYGYAETDPTVTVVW